MPEVHYGPHVHVCQSSTITLQVLDVRYNSQSLCLVHVYYCICEMCQTNRTEMTLEAKRAAKLEKKLKILLGGYQVLWLSVFYFKMVDGVVH